MPAKLQDAQSHVLAVLGDIGGRVNRLEPIANRYEENQLMYTDIKSKLDAGRVDEFQDG